MGVLSNYLILIQDATKEGLNEINNSSSIVIFKNVHTKFRRPNFALFANERDLNHQRGAVVRLTGKPPTIESIFLFQEEKMG